jgi:hypothetical protein
MDILEPILANDLEERELPTKTKSSVDKLEARRAQPYREREDPSLTRLLADKELPR